MRSLLEATSPVLKPFSKKEIAWFQEGIVSWFSKNKRPLPWRTTSDPYKIWISEMMCQQTGVSTVIPYYERFLDRFPNIEVLAAAHEEEVLKFWEGLGYYQRARNLHRAAKMLVENFSGNFPKIREQLLEIPGIGPYSAGAILSLAFRISTPALDGNLIRVYARYTGVSDPVDKPKTLKLLWNLADQFRPERPDWVREFTEGMMDLGAMICTPKNPKCLLCPVRKHCRAYHANEQNVIPRKEKKQERVKKIEWVYWNLRKRKLGFLPKGSDPKYPHFYRLAYRSEDQIPKNYLHRLKYSVTVRDFQVYVTDENFPEKSKLLWFDETAASKLLLPAIDRKILKLQAWTE